MTKLGRRIKTISVAFFMIYDPYRVDYRLQQTTVGCVVMGGCTYIKFDFSAV